ncbi:Wzz/FepE/Etk N-terminal domain-containing protein [Methylobacterium nigriterrae]|uniref:Wzz/FepE/Etk N-terminal domain-containing protein n=1 Tax=Methylobacterium nigriterrae TaxID=3127512 RepID=UPI003D67911B
MIDAPTRVSHRAFSIRSKPVRNTAQPALHELFVGTRRQIVTIVATSALALFLGLLYLAAASPRYSATAKLLIDTQRSSTTVSQTSDGSRDIGEGTGPVHAPVSSAGS